MPLGTLERTPPPFFRQGPSALTKLVCCSALAVFLMAADTRLAITPPLRAVLATVLLPIERTLLLPVRTVQTGATYLQGLAQAVALEDASQRELAAQAERVARVDVLAAENARLRSLLELRPRLWVHSMAAEVLYEARDPFSRKVVIDRGRAQGVSPGSPVINENGVLGQVTRVFPLSAEVTLLTDKDAAIPLLNTRTQQRGAAYGANAGAGMELRFMPGHVDIEVGDLMTTSGVDGVYPPGLPVARVLSVDRRSEGGFARIGLTPLAVSDGVRHVLVLEPLSRQLPEGPVPTDAAAAAALAASAASVPASASASAAAVADAAASAPAPAPAPAASAASAVPRAAAAAAAAAAARPAARPAASAASAARPRAPAAAASAAPRPAPPAAPRPKPAASAATGRPAGAAGTPAPRPARAASAAAARPAAAASVRPAPARPAGAER